MAKTSKQDPFAELVGKKCQLVTQGTTASALVFRWSAISERRRAAFLEDLFGDWSPGEAPLGLVEQNHAGETRWVSAAIPFALVGVDASESAKFSGGDSYPQFKSLLVLDGKGAVLAIDVDGTVVAQKPTRLAPSVGKLGLTLALKVKAAPKGLPGAAAEAVEKSLERLQTNLFKLSGNTQHGKRAEAAKYLAGSEKALTSFTKIFTDDAELSAHPKLSKVPAFYAKLFAQIRGGDLEVYGRALKRFSEDSKYFRWKRYHDAGNPGWATMAPPTDRYSL